MRNIILAAILSLHIPLAGYAEGTDTKTASVPGAEGGGGGAGILDLPVDEFEKVVRKNLPDYPRRAVLPPNLQRRLDRQILIFAYTSSGYNYTDGEWRARHSAMLEAYQKSKLKSLLGRPVSDLTPREFGYSGAVLLPIVKTNYTQDFLRLLVRLLDPQIEASDLVGRAVNMQKFFERSPGCGYLACTQGIIEEMF